MDDPLVTQFLKSLGKEGVVSKSLLSEDFHLELAEKGVSFLFTEDLKVRQISFYLRPTETFSAYTHELPCSVTSTMSLLDVHSILGEPCKLGGGHPGLLGTPVPFWELYDLRTCDLHVVYSDDVEEIVEVSLVARS